MTNERKQSALSKVRSFKHSQTKSNFFVFDFTNEQVKLVSLTWERSISRILILAVPLRCSYNVHVNVCMTVPWHFDCVNSGAVCVACVFP